MKIQILKGDITKIETEAIVNAANSSLLGGGGVDGAIHRAGGIAILDDCMKIRSRQGKCEVGEAVITTAGNLPSNYVIHTVGPVWNGGTKGEPEKLHACYVNSLKLAEEHNIKSLAFPNISTGIYGYPKDLAAKVAWEAVNGYHSEIIEKVIFVCFDDENYHLYSSLK
ncbi:O-acetyl-ADP-ribose deacetylase [Fulvivirga ligni]|uniref:O-acetyl-ADP-ribose deacetylase n=1 Tax=Fulvivirga ligni TaxID=2904246 RepID=UPI001F4281DB|nr:O-acetyl-ADP-ribose deacetylase [Fulvivirga ligni]UII19770.1 O-acetyl-ADP-ribose deacetylase [Fulvivirga ligni]